MLKKLGLFILVSLSAFAADYPPLTPDQAAQFNQQMNQALANANAYVQQAQERATTRELAPDWNSKLQMQNAIIQYEVKKTLVNNFVGTPSLRSALVRDTLLKVLNNNSIDTGDLAQLQSIVLAEKANIAAYDAAQAQQPAASQPTSQTAPVPATTGQ